MIAGGQPVWRFRGLLGVPVEIHGSLIQLVLLILIAVGMLKGDIAYALTIMSILVVSIYLHEVGHAAAARSQRVRVSGIVLHGFGGYCSHAHAAPKQTLVIVLGGPAVNLLLWFLGDQLSTYFVESAYAASPTEPDAATLQMAWYAYFFGHINLWLLAFNLIPVLPLDGGRVLYLGLWYWLPQDQAMRITGFVGLIISILWIPAAIYLFLTIGLILLFFPSIRENWRRFRGEEAI